MRGNREGFARIRLRPRMLVDVSAIDTSTVLFGADTENAGLAGAGGLSEDRFIRKENSKLFAARMPLASCSSRARPPQLPSKTSLARRRFAPWFQLYASSDRPFTKDLVDRAREAGLHVCFASPWTRPVRGQRDRDTRVGFRLPPGLRATEFPRPESTSVDGKSASGRPVDLQPESRSRSLRGSIFDWLRSVAKMPVVLKGVVTAEDAIRASLMPV